LNWNNSKTSRIEHPESCIENIQNKPNSEAYAEPKAKSEFIPIHRERAGKPNLQTLMYLRYRKSLQLVTRRRRTFTHKLQKMRAFCKFLTLTHLTPYTTKTYIKFYLPKAVLPQNTVHGLRNIQNEPNFIQTMNNELTTMNYEKRTQIDYQESSIEKNAKRTQFYPTGHGPRVTSHDLCKTNPISRKKIVSAYSART
jgi:hypothetical protein